MKTKIYLKSILYIYEKIYKINLTLNYIKKPSENNITLYIYLPLKILDFFTGIVKLYILFNIKTIIFPFIIFFCF